MAEAALAYVAAGWPVFPVRPGEKAPLLSRSAGGRGFKDATTDLATVRNWWAKCPEANLGMPTGVLFDVLDVDVKESGTGWPSLERLMRTTILMGCVGIATTRNGGVHLYFPASGHPCRSLPYLDFKAVGGYVLLPPSRVPGDLPGSSGTYAWTTRPTTMDGAPLNWSTVARTLRPSAPTKTPRPSLSGTPDSRLAGLTRVVADAAEGERNNKLFWALCTALRAGYDCQPLLEAAAEVGLDDTEVEITLANARRVVAGPL